MNLNKYISFGAVALIAAAGLSSCDSKNDPAYIPAGTVSDTQRVFFTQMSYNQVVTAEDTSFDFYLYRPDLNILDDNGAAISEMGAQTVTFSVTCAEEGVLGSLITIPTEANFEAGNPYAIVKISCDPAKMTGNHNYQFTIKIDPQYANQYSIDQTTLYVNKEEYTEWTPFVVGEASETRNGEGSYTFTLYYGGTEDPVRVIARSVPTNEKDIQFQFQWLIDNDDPSQGWDTFLTASTEDGGKVVKVEEQHFTDDPDYGEVYVQDTYSYTGSDQYKGLTNFDPETGLFTLNLVYYCSAGIFGNGNEFLQLRGYKDTNVYELTVTPQGQIEVEGKDYEMVSFDFTDAVTYVDYTVVEGELEEEEVNAVIGKMTDPEQTEYTISTLKSSQNVALTFPGSGDYTVVAVGYNEAVDGSIEAKCYAHASFSFKTFDPYAGWTAMTENALYVDDLIPTLVGGELPPADMTVRVDKNDEFKGLYRITNPFADSEYVEMIGASLAPFGSIEFAMLNDGRIYFPISGTGILDGSDEVTIASYSYFAMENGDDPAAIPDQFFGELSEDGTRITMSATGMNPPSFIVWYGTDGPYLCDMDFFLDLSGNEPAGKPALKTGKVEKGLAKIMRAGMMQVKAPVFPAFYKAVPQGAASPRLDRTCVKNLKIRR